MGISLSGLSSADSVAVLVAVLELAMLSGRACDGVAVEILRKNFQSVPSLS